MNSYLIAALALLLALLVAGVIWSWVRLLLSTVAEALERANERREREHERLTAMLNQDESDQARPPGRRLPH